MKKGLEEVDLKSVSDACRHGLTGSAQGIRKGVGACNFQIATGEEASLPLGFSFCQNPGWVFGIAERPYDGDIHAELFGGQCVSPRGADLAVVGGFHDSFEDGIGRISCADLVSAVTRQGINSAVGGECVSPGDLSGVDKEGHMNGLDVRQMARLVSTELVAGTRSYQACDEGCEEIGKQTFHGSVGGWRLLLAFKFSDALGRLIAERSAL